MPRGVVGVYRDGGGHGESVEEVRGKVVAVVVSMRGRMLNKASGEMRGGRGSTGNEAEQG
jgi:hypothetical protein